MILTTAKVVFALKHPVIAVSAAMAMRRHLALSPECAVCGILKWLGFRCHVHHKIPRHLAPDLAADPDNLITLCWLHHWLVGHMGKSWKCYNEKVAETAAALRAAYVATAQLSYEYAAAPRSLWLRLLLVLLCLTLSGCWVFKPKPYDKEQFPYTNMIDCVSEKVPDVRR